jgi:hypothetical protein
MLGTGADIRCNPLRYVPNEPINIVAAVLYFTVAIILTICAFSLYLTLTRRGVQETSQMVHGPSHWSLVRGDWTRLEVGSQAEPTFYWVVYRSIFVCCAIGELPTYDFADHSLVLSLLVITFSWVDWSPTSTRRHTSSPSSQDGSHGLSSSLIVS